MSHLTQRTNTLLPLLLFLTGIILAVTTSVYATSLGTNLSVTGTAGIGTTSPGALLGVQGDILGAGKLTISSIIATSTTATSTLSTGGFTIGTNQFVVQQTSGNVGIGTTSPQYALDITGTSALWQSVYPNDDGLIGWWPLNEGTGTIAYDRSALGNDGTLDDTTNITRVAGKYGTALQFSNQKVIRVRSSDGGQNTDNNNNPFKFGANQDFTVSIWANVASSPGAGNYPELIGNNARGAWSGFALGVRGDGPANIVQFEVYNTCCSPVVNGPVVTDGQWHFFVGERSGDILYLYVDGNLVGSTSGAGSVAFNSSTKALTIGDDPSAFYTNNFKLADARIYSRALSTDEIKTHYIRGRSSNLSLAVGTSTIAANLYGSRSIAVRNGNTTSGTDTTYGSYISSIRSGATGGTINNYGQYITASNSNTVTNSYGLYINSITGATTNYQLYSAGTAPTYLAGNLGIGTTTPNWLMQVNGTRPSLVLSDSSQTLGQNLRHWLFSSMGGNLYIGTSTDLYATSTPAAMTILNNGNVGIGTSSPASATLSVEGPATATTTLHLGNRQSTTNGSCVQMYAPNGTAYRLYVANAGTLTTEAGACK